MADDVAQRLRAIERGLTDVRSARVHARGVLLGAVVVEAGQVGRDDDVACADQKTGLINLSELGRAAVRALSARTVRDHDHRELCGARTVGASTTAADVDGVLASSPRSVR